MAVTAKFDADFSAFDRAVQQAEQGIDGFVAGVAEVATGMLSAQAIMNGLSAAWQAFTGFLDDSVKSAEAAEVAHAKMVTALEAQHTALPSVVSAYGDYATALQKTTIYSDDALQASEALLTQVGNVMPRDMEKALQATTNLASGLGIDLHDATMIVAKAAEGNTNALKKVGVVFDESGGKVQSFGTVLDAITAKFEGQAAVLAGTYQGRLQQLSNAWDSFQGAMGRVIVQNATVLKAIELVTGAIDSNTGELKDNATATTFISDAVILLAKGFDLTLAAINALVEGYALLDRAGTSAATHMLTAFASVADTMLTVANATKYLNPQFYTGELATNMAALAVASQQFHTRLTDIGAASDETQKSTARWSAAIGTAREGLAGMITQLEATRGQTVATTEATKGATNAWDLHTTSIAAGTEAAKQAAIAAKAMEEQQNRAVTIVEGKIAEIIKAWAGYSAAVVAASHDTTQKQIDDVYLNAAAQIAAMEKAKTGSIQAYEAIQAAADQLAGNIVAKNIEADATTRAHYQLVADQAKAAYDFALAHATEYTDARIAQLQKEADAATVALQNWSRNAVTAVEQIKAPAVEAAAAIKGMHDQLLEMTNVGTKLPGSKEETDSMGNRYLISPTGQRVPMGPHGEMPGNWWEMYTGQGSTPEAFNPLLLQGRRNVGTLAGAAAASNVTVNVEGNVLGTQNELAKMVGDAITNSFRTGGSRLPA
jgi:hypothetical protein